MGEEDGGDHAAGGEHVRPQGVREQDHPGGHREGGHQGDQRDLPAAERLPAQGQGGQGAQVRLDEADGGARGLLGGGGQQVGCVRRRGRGDGGGGGRGVKRRRRGLRGSRVRGG